MDVTVLGEMHWVKQRGYNSFWQKGFGTTAVGKTSCYQANRRQVSTLLSKASRRQVSTLLCETSRRQVSTLLSKTSRRQVSTHFNKTSRRQVSTLLSRAESKSPK